MRERDITGVASHIDHPAKGPSIGNREPAIIPTFPSLLEETPGPRSVGAMAGEGEHNYSEEAIADARANLADALDDSYLFSRGNPIVHSAILNAFTPTLDSHELQIVLPNYDAVDTIVPIGANREEVANHLDKIRDGDEDYIMERVDNHERDIRTVISRVIDQDVALLNQHAEEEPPVSYFRDYILHRSRGATSPVFDGFLDELNDYTVETFGRPDPDMDRVEMVSAVEALKMVWLNKNFDEPFYPEGWLGTRPPVVEDTTTDSQEPTTPPQQPLSQRPEKSDTFEDDLRGVLGDE